MPPLEACLTETLAIRVGELLRRAGLKLALAESCTGGLVGHQLTEVPGSSDYFLGAIVAYAYEAKVALLGVSWDTLRAHGAVSRETALEMARGARRALSADLALSVTGIAGPGGATPEKPVGLTWTALCAPDGEWTRVFVWHGDRSANKASSAEAVLQLLLDYLQGRRDLDRHVP